MATVSVTIVTAAYDLPAGGALRGRGAGLAPYLRSLASLTGLGAPMVVYASPQHAPVLERFAQDEGFRWQVVSDDLDGRQQRPLGLNRGRWLREQALANPFDSERLYWMDAALSSRECLPDAVLGPDGFECALCVPSTLESLTQHDGIRVFRDAARLVASCVGGEREAVRAFGDAFERAVNGADASHAGDILREMMASDPSAYDVVDLRTMIARLAAESGMSPQGTPSTLATASPVRGRGRRIVSDVTAILNTYMRPHTLRPQYEAVMQQSVAPDDVMVWQNYPDDPRGATVRPEDFDADVLDRCITAGGRRTNFGVWARFAFALNARTKYVCIFDDDTMPGERWFENCLETIATHRGLLGTIGVLQTGPTYYEKVRVGWSDPNAHTTRVDYVGHAWFFEREWLTAFWRELPPPGLISDPARPFALTAGEDMHFSYVLQRYLGLETYVPPHPVDDPRRWGAEPMHSVTVGTDAVAVSNVAGEANRFETAFHHYRANGFRFVYEG